MNTKLRVPFLLLALSLVPTTALAIIFHKCEATADTPCVQAATCSQRIYTMCRTCVSTWVPRSCTPLPAPLTCTWADFTGPVL